MSFLGISSIYLTNRGDRYSIRNTLELYELLQNNGPLYAFHKGEDGSHLVVITGINLYNGKVYTNNPQGYLGIQSYVDFLRGYAIGNGQTKANRQLTYIYTVTNPT